MRAYQSWSLESDLYINEEGDEVCGEEYALIEKIFVPAHERGRGVGTELLREAIAEIRAAHGGVAIKLAALPLDRDTELLQLVAWYEREGFSVESLAGDAVVMTYDR